MIRLRHISDVLRVGAASLALCVFCTVFTACGGSSSRTSRHSGILAELDDALSDREVFAADREAKIRESRAQLEKVESDSDAYNICRTLFSAYRNYRVDSALLIANRRLSLADATGNESRIISASLNLAECLSAAANYTGAIGILDRLDRNRLAGFQQQYLFKIYCDTYGRMSLSDGLESNKLHYRMLYRQYQDSALRVLAPDDRHYHYIRARQFLESGYPRDALKEMEHAGSASGAMGQDPKMMYELGMIYHDLGRESDEIDALARSAILYISSGQRDYPSLMDLAVALNETGDPARAYRYIMAALEDASFCNSRSRTSQIPELVPLISSAYSAMENESLRRAWRLTAVIIALAAVCAGCCVWAYVQLRKKRRVGRQLEIANEHLKSINIALETANQSKIDFISRLFGIYSDYIDRIDAYRKKIRQLLKMSQPGAALECLESNKIVADELKDMYRRFDAMFLELYPDFISTYNSLVHSDERIAPDARSHPAKVRVLALMKIGITEPADIARMLHYTPQTIYNYCSHLRAASKVPYGQFESVMLSDSLKASCQNV